LYLGLLKIYVMLKQLDRGYYEDNDVLFLAPDLLGKLIVTDFEGIRTSAWITETEAYRAPEDKASHAFGNRRTKRTEIMFGPGGYSYVYLNYGIHHLFNIVTSKTGHAHAILIRAIWPLENAAIQLERRKTKKRIKKSLFDGPGKLSQALGIRTIHNGMDLCASKSSIRIFDAGKKYEAKEILSGPRIGIDYAEEWKDKYWRYLIKKDNAIFSEGL